MWGRRTAVRVCTLSNVTCFALLVTFADMAKMIRKLILLSAVNGPAGEAESLSSKKVI
jgi:hypothetical protein